LGSCRLYLITPPSIADIGAFQTLLETALDGGDVACLQLRLKGMDGTVACDEDILVAAAACLDVLRPRQIPLLINDRADLAAKAGADGVHLGQEDGSVVEARALLGEAASIGVTCHNSRDLALRAGEAGADYVAFGAFFPTRTKVAPTQADPDLLTWWQEMTTVPCIAIGGITAQNTGPLVRAGADFLAVSSAVWSHPDGPAAGVRAMNAAIASD